MGYLRISPFGRGFSPFSFIPFSFLTLHLPLMIIYIGLTMISSSNVFANKRHVASRLSPVNVPALNYLLRSKIFVSDDRQLRAVHLVLDYEPLSRNFQEVGQAIRAGDPRLAHIAVSVPGFLARKDRPPVILLPQQILPEVAVALREEIASSRSSLEEEINKFHFEEDETQGAQIVHISDTKEETDRHSGVHAPILVIACPDSTSEEEENEMALNQGNKILRDLMVARNNGSTSQEVPKSQVPPIFPPPPPLPPIDLGLHDIPNLKKKRPVQELEEGEMAPQKGTKQQKTAKDPKDKRSISMDSQEKQNLAEVCL